MPNAVKENVNIYLDLLASVLPREMHMIPLLLEAYAAACRPVQEHIHSCIENIIRSIVTSLGNDGAVQVARLIRNTIKKSEPLAVQILSSLCDYAGKSIHACFL
jgi:hypothetical protein